jgi:putative ABC transport system permease protein
MLVAVTERTREIGIREAIDARPRDVLMRVLLEALGISVCGAAVGVIAGHAVTAALRAWPGWRSVIPFDAVVLAGTTSIAIGLVFGLYPAAKASQLDPIDALRFD